MRTRGEELYSKVLDANHEHAGASGSPSATQLADLRVEITTGIAEAASIPWELMRDPQSDSPIALRVQGLRARAVQSQHRLRPRARRPTTDASACSTSSAGRAAPTTSPCARSPTACCKTWAPTWLASRSRPLRPPTFERLQTELQRRQGRRTPLSHRPLRRPRHLRGPEQDHAGRLAEDASAPLTLGGQHTGKHGYLLFEHPGNRDRCAPSPAHELGKLLHDTGVPVLVLNACQSAMHEAAADARTAPPTSTTQVRAIGSLAQAVIDQGIPAVLGMRYSVFVVTAAQYIGELYAALAKGRTFGEAASEGRKHLAAQPRPLGRLAAAPAAGLVRARRLRGHAHAPAARQSRGRRAATRR